jgi:preprotein translocase subunit Sec61beta
MAKKKRSEGIQQAAGLVRYYEQEDSVVQVSPWVVVGVCIGMATLIAVLGYLASKGFIL